MSGMAEFQDALGDYYDAGMIGEPPRREDYGSQPKAEWPDIPRATGARQA